MAVWNCWSKPGTGRLASSTGERIRIQITEVECGLDDGGLCQRTGMSEQPALERCRFGHKELGMIATAETCIYCTAVGHATRPTSEMNETTVALPKQNEARV